MSVRVKNAALILKVSSAVAAVILAQSALAQTESTSGGSAGGNEVKIEDIVVTATKRTENVQNIPIAVSAFNAQALERAGVQDTRQLMAIAPSLNLTSTTSDARGVRSGEHTSELQAH